MIRGSGFGRVRFFFVTPSEAEGEESRRCRAHAIRLPRVSRPGRKVCGGEKNREESGKLLQKPKIYFTFTYTTIASPGGEVSGKGLRCRGDARQKMYHLTI